MSHLEPLSLNSYTGGTEATPLLPSSKGPRTPRFTKKQPRRSEPLLADQRQCTLSTAVFNMTVSAVGAGVLVIPFSMRCAGLIGGVALLTISAVASLVSLDLLEEASRLSSPQQYSFEGVAKFWGGVRMERMVQLNLCLLLLFGALTTLTDLAGTLVLPLLDVACGTGNSCWWASRSAVITMMDFSILPLCVAENLHSLRYTSTLALACVAFLVVAVIVIEAQHMSQFGIHGSIAYLSYVAETVPRARAHTLREDGPLALTDTPSSGTGRLRARSPTPSPSRPSPSARSSTCSPPSPRSR
jgi:hypothetical protein